MWKIVEWLASFHLKYVPSTIITPVPREISKKRPVTLITFDKKTITKNTDDICTYFRKILHIFYVICDIFTKNDVAS